MLGQHIFCRLKNDNAIAKDIGGRRLVAETVLRIGRRLGLLGFGLADTHLQMSATGSEGGDLGRRVEYALTRRLRCDPGFAGVGVLDVETP